MTPDMHGLFRLGGSRYDLSPGRLRLSYPFWILKAPAVTATIPCLPIRRRSKTMRIAILGNSGSGKSTLARWLAGQSGAALLDLDTVAWAPHQIAVPRLNEDATADVQKFCSAQDSWVIEGCYANLVRSALCFEPMLLFLNPGKEQCITNCQSRPWEPHKYTSMQQQDERLPFLLSWVTDYYTRNGELSLSAHVECFHAYTGPKEELLSLPQLAPPSAKVSAWLD
jgi:adenylate kinase family enzyme